ncbi:zinc ribbon domain-containing protein [Streptomyces sp. KL2]|uniref:zinc ribbon domain-containing protein n=1 Tax=Streptomyces sp. KL2 TaxID=3050126 RepID=UPI00397C28BD
MRRRLRALGTAAALGLTGGAPGACGLLPGRTSEDRAELSGGVTSVRLEGGSGDVEPHGRERRRRVPAPFGGVPRRHGTRTIVADRRRPSSKTCSGCGAVKAEPPLHVRTYQRDACGLVVDRDGSAALNLAALAAAAVTGTGVAGDQDTAPAVSKPRGADQRTRATRTRRKTVAERAGGAIPSRQRQGETRDRTQAGALTLWRRDGPSIPKHPECREPLRL